MPNVIMPGVIMEEVVLLDEEGHRIGTADKATVHHQETPLHLAFSAYVFDPQGELLITRRATSKRTWPGVWTNSCCGHPLPGESLPDAVERRLEDELGVRANSIDLVLPNFRYRAEMANGVVENELCPVFRVTSEDMPSLDPAEVADAAWVTWEGLVAAVEDEGTMISPWCREQVSALGELAEDPRDWPAADPALLPPAARPQGRFARPSR